MGVKLQLLLGLLLIGSICGFEDGTTTIPQILLEKVDSTKNLIQKLPKTDSQINLVNKDTQNNSDDVKYSDYPSEIDTHKNETSSQEIVNESNENDGKGRQDNSRSIDIEKIDAQDFQNNDYLQDNHKFLENSIYKSTTDFLPFSFTTPRSSLDFEEAKKKTEETYENTQLTTPSTFFDNTKFEEVKQKLETDYDGNQEDHLDDETDDVYINKLFGETKTKPNSTLNYKEKTKISKNNTITDGSEYNELRVERTHNINYDSLLSFTDEDEATLPNETLETSSSRGFVVTTRKRFTKPPTSQSSHILNNKIEAETIKAINFLTTDYSTTQRLKEENDLVPKEQSVEENKIIPLQTILPNSTPLINTTTEQIHETSPLETTLSLTSEQASETSTTSYTEQNIETTQQGTNLDKSNHDESITKLKTSTNTDFTDFSLTTKYDNPTTTELLTTDAADTTTFPTTTTQNDNTLEQNNNLDKITKQNATIITENSIIKLETTTTITTIDKIETTDVPITTKDDNPTTINVITINNTTEHVINLSKTTAEQNAIKITGNESITKLEATTILTTDKVETTNVPTTTEYNATTKILKGSLETTNTQNVYPTTTNIITKNNTTKEVVGLDKITTKSKSITKMQTTTTDKIETTDIPTTTKDDYPTTTKLKASLRTTTTQNDYPTTTNVITTDNTNRISKAFDFESTYTSPDTTTEIMKIISTTDNLTLIMTGIENETTTGVVKTSGKVVVPKILQASTTPSTETSLNTLSLNFSSTNVSVVSEETTVRTTTEDSFESSPVTESGNIGTGEDNKGKIAAIIISTVGAVCLIILAGLLYVMRKRQRRFNYKQRCRPVGLDDYSVDNVSGYNSTRRKAGRQSKRSYGNPAFDDPVAITHPLNFPALAKFATNAEDIKSEFKEIPQITVKTNELPEGCETKNRYANIIPLPETRVFLQHIDGYPNSDYINANYVTGPKNTKGYYIACQAPMSNTVDDFWRMVWEQQTKVILMLTHLFENGVEKCIDYLPPSEVLDCNRLFGDFQVTLKKRDVKEKYIISNLQLKNMVSNSWREVTHFWYLGWPERGVPAEENSIIAFLIEARSYMKSATLDKNASLNGSNGTTKNEVNPVVVHCSPGTGRTGVVIACDIAIRKFEQTRLVDVPKIVYRIRRDRANAVQTKEQYIFIYKVVSLYASKLTGGALDSF